VAIVLSERRNQEMRTISLQVDGDPLVADVYDSSRPLNGPPVLLIHGWGGSGRYWQGTVERLGDRFTFVVPDLPGVGRSLPVRRGRDIFDQVRAIEALLTHLNISHIHLVGHSMGGAIAGLYASQHPGDVGALVLIDSAGVPFKDNAFTRELKAGRNPFDLQNRADFAKLQKSLFAHPPWLPPRIQDVFVHRAIRDRDFDDRVLKEIASPDQRDVLTAALPKVTAPTLAIWCRQDRIIDISALDAIRDDLKSAPQIGVTEFSDCGPMSIMERARESADAITRFVLMP